MTDDDVLNALSGKSSVRRGVNGSLPMLSRVSRPIGTSPNQRLRHVARRLDQSTMSAEALERITGRVTTLPVTSWMTAPPQLVARSVGHHDFLGGNLSYQSSPLSASPLREQRRDVYPRRQAACRARTGCTRSSTTATG